MSYLVTPLQQGLAGLCGLLAIVLFWQLLAPSLAMEVSPIAWHPSGLDVPLAPVPPPPANTFAQINERPIFSPTRKPVTPTPKAAEVPASPPDATLIGVIIDGQNRLALVRTSASPLEVSLALGASLGPWTVTAIEPDHISLRAGTDETEIRLNANHGSASGTQPDQTSNTTEPAPPGTATQPATNNSTTVP
jgi:hypothetical protein